MAAISIPQSPKDSFNMSTTRRVPLSSNANAVNSPFRPTVGAVSKQKRSYANVQREEAYGQPPPAKKQMLDSFHVVKTPPRQQSTQNPTEGRVLVRKAIPSQHNSFERKGVTVRERSQQTVVKAEKVSGQDLEGIKAWQKHYRKVFPTCVFYFESVPEDIRQKYTRKVLALGAKEEKFFSNAVTHVITTRQIPAEQTNTEIPVTSSTNENTSQHSLSKTINPSLLDRSSESTNTISELGGTKFTFEAPAVKKLVYNDHDVEIKKPQASNDVLNKARALGIKIWALEKLQRMVKTMFDTDTGYQVVHGHNTRSNSVQGSTTVSKTAREADIQQLLRNERINGPSDRDPTVTTKELAIFKGPYLYVHCHFGKHRPMMIREYAKVAHKEDGDWPQFRSVANGKCPFVEEVDHSRREAEKEKEMIRLQKEKEKERLMVPRTRSAAAVEARMQPPKSVIGKRALSEMENESSRSITVSTKQVNPFAPGKSSLSTQVEPVPSSRGAQNAFVSRAAGAKLFAGEPVASGIQPSNITSAIRSTMISSTAAQPGAKAGTSKEVHGLQRKLLEKNSGGPGSFGMVGSHHRTDTSVATREESVSRTLKGRANKLGLIEEDADPSEADEKARKVDLVRKTKVVQQRKEKKRDPKPGYCENCQEKFDDFEDHVVSRKHRKFAEKLENWKDLDSLLQQLARPLREQFDDEDY